MPNGMPDINPLYFERMGGFMSAVNFQKQDRTPIMLTMDSFAAQQKGMTIAEFVQDPIKGTKAQLDMMDYLRADTVEHPGFDPRVLSTLWLSKMKIPGIQLPDNELWQVDEAELMTREDYDAIIDMGFEAWVQKYYLERLDNLMGQLGPFFGKMPQIAGMYLERGYPCLAMGINIATPFDYFCGGRSMVRFFQDLRKIPDKVIAAMDVAMEYIIKNAMGLFEQTHAAAAWVSGWRCASNFISRDAMEKFVWPYFQKLVETVVEIDKVPLLHMDSDWQRDLDLFLALPKRKCVFEPDGATDIYEVKKVLGDHMCISGDVPPAMLTLGTPDEVYTYSRKLIGDMGPGYIHSMGCTIPMNAKLENVKAMCDAAYG